jgi:hypothetical protein
MNRLEYEEQLSLDISKLIHLSTAPITIIFIYILKEIYETVVVGAVDKWISRQISLFALQRSEDKTAS